MNDKPTAILFNPATLAWLVLVVATGIGWWFGHTAQSNNPGNLSLAIAGVIITAFVKTWIVGFQFMELKTAPRWLRHAFDAWTVIICVTLLIICLH